MLRRNVRRLSWWMLAVATGCALAGLISRQLRTHLRYVALRALTTDVVDLAAGATRTLDLTQAAEARRWRAGAQVRTSPGAMGLRLEARGEDPSVRRRVWIPAGTLGSIVLRTQDPARSAPRVYLRFDGQESEAAAVDALPLDGDATTLVATLPDGPWWTEDVDGLRLDPGPDDAQITLRSVTFRAPGPGRFVLGDVSAICAGFSPYAVPLDIPAGARARVLVGLPGSARGARLHVDGRAGIGPDDAQPTALVSGWQEIQIDTQPGRQTLRLSVRDANGRQRAACLTAPIIVPAGASQRPDILLVSLDTLRADALADAPFLTALAQRGRGFTRAYSASNWTLPAHVSLLTSRPYREHHVPGPEWRPTHMASLPAQQLTLAARLHAAGYATAASTEGGFLDSAFGFDHGFERYAQWRQRETGDGLAAESRHLAFAREFVAKRGTEPFFLFVHSYVVHDYCTNSPAYHERLADGDAAWAARGNLCALLRGPGERPAGAFLRRLYATGVGHADRLVARLLAELRARARTRPLLVVVTSDHGESFGEHGYWQHGSSLHEQQAHVPLLAWDSRGGWQGGTWDDEVSTLDVAPSLLRAVGLPVPTEFRGADDRFLPTRPRDRRVVEARSYVADHDAGVGHIDDALWARGWKRLRVDSYDGATLHATCYDLRHDADEARRTDGAARCAELSAHEARLLAAGGVGRVRMQAHGPITLELAGARWQARGFVAVRASRPSPAPLLSADGLRLSWAGHRGDSLMVFTLPGAAPVARLSLDGRVLAEQLGLGELGTAVWAQGAVRATGWPRATTGGHAPPELRERLRALGYLE